MLGIPLGLLYSNAWEWVLHKHVLHGLGRNKKDFWSFHWHEHHRNVRRNEMHDPDYRRPVFGWHAQGKEALAVALLGLLHVPLIPVAPFFAATVILSGAHYYRLHKRSHMDPAWAREHLPWHYDHHMGPDQDKNWCVTRPWFDVIMGTRVPYVGTPREAEDRARAERRRASLRVAEPAPAPAAAPDGADDEYGDLVPA